MVSVLDPDLRLYCISSIIYALHTIYTQLVLEDELAADDSTDTVDLKIPPSTSTALRLNNNMLSHWEGFGETLSRLFVSHAAHLHWVDLAFNEIRTIDEVLCWYTLEYFHGRARHIYNIIYKPAILS